MAIFIQDLLFVATACFIFIFTQANAQTTCGAPTTTADITWVVGSTAVATTLTSVSYVGSTSPTPTTTTTATTARFLTVNTQWPAEPIIVEKCTQVKLTVLNNISLNGEDMSLHFHGITQKGGQVVMDGPEGITQSGIPPGKTFVYSFRADQEGTYWIHSHHPGQYPKGIRAPLIVRNTEDRTFYDYTEPPISEGKKEIITLSDWFVDFWNAEDRSTSLVTNDNDRSKGTCGLAAEIAATGEKPNLGLEYPPDRVLMNDVGGYETTPDQERKVYKVKCGQSHRIRFINMSSHAKFYVWFSDNRRFKIIELDGVSYQPYEASMFEIVSGQRVSIRVTGGATGPSSDCNPAYIIAASDPKVGHGSKRCPGLYTDASRGVQFTHGYLDVEGGTRTSMDRLTKLSPTNSAQVGDVSRWTVYSSNDLTGLGSLFHFYPSKSIGGWENTDNGHLYNRMKLGYKTMYSDDRTDLDGLKNYDYVPAWDREFSTPVGLNGAHDFDMVPKDEISPWYPPRPSGASPYIHYIKLFRLGDPKRGFAAMMENPAANGDNFGAWISPEAPTNEQPTLKSQSPIFPSLFRALESGVTDQALQSPGLYQRTGTSNGRTIMIPDEDAKALTDDDQTAHWFVIRSDLGDHPMHLHGHHFQVLAELPAYWFDSDKASVIDLYDWVRSNGVSKKGFDGANPMRRDTLWVEKDIVYVIAIKPDNPGIWAFHCHNDIHAVSGMFSQVVERPKALRRLLGTWYYSTTSSLNIWNFAFNQPDGYVPALSQAVQIAMRQAMEKYGWNPSSVKGKRFTA